MSKDKKNTSNLTEEQIAAFKQILLEQHAELTDNITTSNETVKKMQEDTKGYSQHQADEGTEDFERSISISLNSKERSILYQVNRALEKIEEGTYGICDITNEPIGIKRLNAIPHATTTVHAQESIENNT
mgnify:CR=1 FL=1